MKQGPCKPSEDMEVSVTCTFWRRDGGGQRGPGA